MHIRGDIARLVLLAIIIYLDSASPTTASLASPEAACNADAARVGCWQMEEGSGRSTADESQSSPLTNLTLSNSEMWTTDRLGNCNKVLNRNGSKYVGVPDTDSLDISGDITIAAWATPQVETTMYLVKKAMQGTIVVGQELGMAAGSGTTCTPATNPCPFGRFRYATGDGDAYRINGSGNYTATDSWTHNAVTKSGTTLLICKNGVQIGTRKVATITIGTNTLVLGFGPQIDGSGTASSFFTGSLDVNRIYRRALYVNEIPSLVDHEPQAATTTSQPGSSRPGHRRQ